MIVYDVTNQKSFDNISNWMKGIKKVCHVNFHPALVILQMLYIHSVHHHHVWSKFSLVISVIVWKEEKSAWRQDKL